MDTSILHTRIKEYKAKAKNPISQEMIFLFETWLVAIDNHVSEVEIENYVLTDRIIELTKTIEILTDILIVTGNSDKVVLLEGKDQYVDKAIRMLLESKDRQNHLSLSAISSLLYINRDKSFTSIEELKAYVTG